MLGFANDKPIAACLHQPSISSHFGLIHTAVIIVCSTDAAGLAPSPIVITTITSDAIVLFHMETNYFYCTHTHTQNKTCLLQCY